MSAQYRSHDESKFQSVIQFLGHCSQTKNLKGIKKFHAHLLRTGLLLFSPNLQTKVIFSYSSCLTQNTPEILANLCEIVTPKNPLMFNSIMSHFSQNGFHSIALQTFSFMHLNAVHIDSYALCSALSSSSGDKNLIFGKKIHSHAEKSGWLSSMFVGSALIDFYAKSSCVNDASVLFDEIPVKNSVCANALLSGYAEAKMWSKGLKLVRQMPMLSLDPDSFTFSAALRSCVGLSAIGLGSQIHATILRRVCDLGADVFLLSLLIEMYGKCGLVEKATQIFTNAGFGQERENKRDVILWTTMLGVCGKNGNYKQVILLFEDMLMEGVRPDGVAFLSVLSACSHTGQVDLGFEYFEAMTRDFGLQQSPEHYGCLIDAVCRSGELDKAWELISSMPSAGNGSSTVALWGALVSACSECGNINLGRLAARRALELDPQNTGIYVLLSNMYASHGMWNEIEQLRELMKGRNIRKDTGYSWIDVTS